MSASQSVADESQSLLFGTAERRQQLGYEDDGLQGQPMQQESQDQFETEPVFMGPTDNGSGSASGNVEAIPVAPPPPQTPHPLRADVNHWASTNTGVQNADGTQSVDMGFNVTNQQYTGNSPTGTTVMGRRPSASSMEWERVGAPLGNPGAAPNMVGERVRPSANPGLAQATGTPLGTTRTLPFTATPNAMPRVRPSMAPTNFAGVYGPPQNEPWPSQEPLWNRPVHSNILSPPTPGTIPTGYHNAQSPPIGSVPPGLGQTMNSGPPMGVRPQAAPSLLA